MKTIISLILVLVAVASYAAEIDVKLNEILYDVPAGDIGDANRDGIRDAYQDEFVEIFNSGSTAVDISNWVIVDTSTDEFVFPSGTIIGPGEFITLFGGGAPIGFIGQVFIDDGRIGNGLSNDGELVFLKNAVNIIIDSYTDNGATTGQSAYRWLDGIGDWFIETGATGIAIFTPQASNRDRALPVVLSSFTADSTNDVVVLKWRTESETNNLGFQVYRDDKPIGNLIKSKGDSGTYEFIDDDVVFGKTYFYFLEDIDFSGNRKKSQILEIKVGRKIIANYVKPKFALFQNYPNPFNPETWIPFRLAEKSDVKIQIYDIFGRSIYEFGFKQKRAGYHSEKFDFSDLSSGVYFYTLQAREFSATKKMVIVK